MGSVAKAMDWKNRIIAHGTKPASQFLANPLNPRKHPPSQRAAVKGSLDELGWVQNVIESASGVLIDGHERVWQALQNDDAEVPYVQVDLSPEEERLALAILDPISALAETDKDQLDALLREVSTGDVALQAMLAELAKENGLYLDKPKAEDPGVQIDRAEELREKWGTASSQLWEIPSHSVSGKAHRLLCGDSTRAEDVARLMGGEKSNVCFTSPPYAQQREYGNAIENWDALMQGVFAVLPMVQNSQVLVNLGLVHQDGEWMPYWDGWIEWMRSQGWRRFGWYVWDQGPGIPGDWAGRFAPSHEFVFHFNRVAVKPSKSVECKNAGASTGKRTFRNADGTLDTFTQNGAAIQSHKIADSVIRVTRQHGVGIWSEHPAVFPVGLPSYVIDAWPGTVYDPFLGSGTTLVACERLGRIGYGCELSPAYVAVALERLFGMGLEPRLADG